MPATVLHDDTLLTVELRINLGPALTRAMPHVGPMNTSAGLEELYDSDPFDVDLRYEGVVR